MTEPGWRASDEAPQDGVAGEQVAAPREGPSPSLGPARDGTWPAVSLSGVTELRIHGVGGTPPADMLDTPAVEQVAGDRTAGFWRAPESAPGRHVEAYAWGGLTARGATSALWLIVLPFALVNLAGWMAPSRTAATSRGTVRTCGLVVTLLYVEFAARPRWTMPPTSALGRRAA